MMTGNDLARLQTEQFRHDQRNHSDITCLPKPDRLKHYGLHFAKYVGRLARPNEPKSAQRTMTDTALVCLSAANTLHQRLEAHSFSGVMESQVDPFRILADAAGRFADACEKIDHLEDFIGMATEANLDVMKWVLAYAQETDFDLEAAIISRRAELANRQFYIKD